MNQIRLSELLPGKTFHWREFFVRNIPNTRLESRVIPSTQCFEYLHYHTKQFPDQGTILWRRSQKISSGLINQDYGTGAGYLLTDMKLLISTAIFLTRLRELIESYEQQIDESEKLIQKSGIISISLAFLALVTIIFLQRRKILETQKVNTLVRNNSELEKERMKVSGELTAVRKSINNIARENLEKLNELRSLIANQEGYESDTDKSFKDLNIIRIHQEGITRFKINRFCDDLNDKPLKKFEPMLSEQEFKIFKLMILEFRSKEIAIILDVSHQYINNKRHKIRTSLAEAGFELDDLVTALRKELYA
ncbi:MAG: hypothetical protein DA444_05215 [Bacteroidetes bacterium]|nr:MAG: hypothetical protein DA444_05215 [Bacteroidota bacterium]